MKKITQAIERHRMFEKGDSVVVGLSGGADSVVLTHFLHHYGVKVFAVHINHLLRGEESLRDEQFVIDFCNRLSIPLELHRIDVAAEARDRGIGVELAGREIRYRIFLGAAKKVGAVVATAHTLSDQAETVLFRLARGSGSRGLSGIPAVRELGDGIRVVRPLIGLSRGDIEAYCKEHALSYVVDSSNLTDDYARNLIRNRVLPLLHTVNEAAERHIGETAAELAQEDDFLAEEARKAYTKCKTESGLSAEKIVILHPAIQKRVVMLFLAENGVGSDRLLVQRVLDLSIKNRHPEPDKRYGAVSLPGNAECLLRGGRLSIEKADEVGAFPEIFPERNGSYRMPSGRKWEIILSDTKPIQNVHKNLFFFCLDYDKIKGKLICRGRMPSDRIRISGRNVTKTVKKWMNEEKVPMRLRDRLFVLADEQGVVAVEGLGISSRIEADEETKRFLILSAMI